MGMCRGHGPLFSGQSPLVAHQFTVNAPLLCPLFSVFRKFLHFQPCFGQNLSSLDPKFSKFLFPRPPFFKENPLPRPYILKPAWHTPTEKKVECPPPPGDTRTCKVENQRVFKDIHRISKLNFINIPKFNRLTRPSSQTLLVLLEIHQSRLARWK